MPEETVTLGRAKRATAGNRMRELLEKAHQQDEEDMFKEEEGDEEFAAPQDVRDVFLDEFADTDDEVEQEDEEEEERRVRREERKRKKAKTKGIYNPLEPSKTKRVQFPAEPTMLGRAEHQPLLDPSLDASKMAPSTLLLALRKQRRDQKRLARDQNLRSSLRASTLKTEEEIAQRAKEEKTNPNRKGKRAQHETGVIRVVKKMTQDELIAAALEEEERNKEDLRDWLRKEDEKRELRRVGRKRVRGPRWTWVSRTVGKLVEEVGGGDVARMAAARSATTPIEATPAPAGSAIESEEPKQSAGSEHSKEGQQEETNQPEQPDAGSTSQPDKPEAESVEPPVPATPGPKVAPRSSQPAQSEPPAEGGSSAYARNYIILSQIPGGLKSELELVLGDHVEWDNVKYIPHRNRPINRRPVICPFTGQPANYRDPRTLVPYSSTEAFNQIDALLANRYFWNGENSIWYGGEDDVSADGAADVPGWTEAVNGGWLGSKPVEVAPQDPLDLGARKVGKRKFFGDEEEPAKKAKGKSRKAKRN